MIVLKGHFSKSTSHTQLLPQKHLVCTETILRRRVQRARAPLPLMPNFPQSLTPPSAIHFTHIFIQPTSYTFAHPQMLTLSHTIHFIIIMISLYRLYYTFVLDRILFRASIQSIFNNSAECTVISVNMPTLVVNDTLVF